MPGSETVRKNVFEEKRRVFFLTSFSAVCSALWRRIEDGVKRTDLTESNEGFSEK